MFPLYKDPSEFPLYRLQFFHIKLYRIYGIIKIGIFGSYTRNDQQDTSDVDILIKFNKALGFEFMSIKYYLEDKLGVKVDLATEAMIRPQLREKTLKEIVYLWDDTE